MKMRNPLSCTLVFTCIIAASLLADPAHSVKPASNVASLIEDLGLRETPEPIKNSPYWRKPRKVVALLPDSRIPARKDYKKWLHSAAGDAKLIFIKSLEELQLEKADADVYLGYCHHVTPDMKNLRWVQNYFVGIDRCTENSLLREGKVLLTNTKAIPGPGMAEHTIAMMLMLARKMHIYYQQQQKSQWRRLSNAGKHVVEVNGKTMLVVGLGGIGRQVAKRAHGLGMRVIATRNSSRKGPDYVDYVGLADEMTELAKKADVVVNITPLTEATRGMFNRDFFETMKPTAFFINIGRGKSVVTEDLVVALNTNEIAGAALDVTDPEPLPANHPLWKLPNVIITPHNSAPSDQMLQRFWTLVRENLRRYTAGEPMLNVVDINRGY
jgi:phosphoglycerate dehydrogenase-like enzyme